MNIYCIIIFAVGFLSVPLSAQDVDKIELPVEFHNGVIYVVPQMEDCVRLRFLTDTGSGTFIYGHAFDKLKLPSDGDGESVAMPKFATENWIPEPKASKGRLYIFRGKSLPGSEKLTGMLGAFWFSERTWFFDYQNQKLFLLNSHNPPEDHRGIVPIHFQKNGEGAKTTHFPRITAMIAGEEIEMLFDTGAHTLLTEAAQKRVGDGHGELRATSFIVNSIFQKWRDRHPDWLVIERAEETYKEDMILVPTVTIAGMSVGPVWFTRRADKNFHEYMSQWMDERVDGAIGGSALHYFNIVVDYPNEVAIFEKFIK